MNLHEIREYVEWCDKYVENTDDEPKYKPTLPKDMYQPCPECLERGSHLEDCVMIRFGHRTAIEVDIFDLWQLQEQAFVAGYERGRGWTEEQMAAMVADLTNSGEYK